MNTAETEALATTFRERADAAQSRGDAAVATAWQLAATELSAAECDSIVAAFERSRKRRSRKQKLQPAH